MGDLLIGAWKTQALVAAVTLDVFNHIAEGKRTVKDIAVAAGASQRGITNLLDALVGMNYLRKTGSRYGLQPISSTFLVRGKKTYMGASTEPVSLTWELWNHLTESVKTGKPGEALNVAKNGREFFPKLVSSIFPGNFAAATEAVSHFTDKERRQIHKILDVAAGSGAWSLAFAQAIPDARVTTVDFPEMTPITRGFAEKLGVAGRYDYYEGDVRQVDFGRDAYDLVILGHIIHSEGEKHGKEPSAKVLRGAASGRKTPHRGIYSRRHSHRSGDAGAIWFEHASAHGGRKCIYDASIPRLAQGYRLPKSDDDSVASARRR